MEFLEEIFDDFLKELMRELPEELADEFLELLKLLGEFLEELLEELQEELLEELLGELVDEFLEVSRCSARSVSVVRRLCAVRLCAVKINLHARLARHFCRATSASLISARLARATMCRCTFYRQGLPIAPSAKVRLME